MTMGAQQNPVEGSLPLGVLAGLFGGILGFVLVYVLAKGAATKKGALYGLIGQFCLGILFGVLVPLLFGRSATP